MRNFRSRCPQIMIPCKEVEVSQISRKERKKENISGEVGVVISRWSNLLIDPCNFFHGCCKYLGEGCHLSLKVIGKGV